MERWVKIVLSLSVSLLQSVKIWQASLVSRD
nr:MAG TPA: hypothetical protein [Caudoviricetes sp.]